MNIFLIILAVNLVFAALVLIFLRCKKRLDIEKSAPESKKFSAKIIRPYSSEDYIMKHGKKYTFFGNGKN